MGLIITLVFLYLNGFYWHELDINQTVSFIESIVSAPASEMNNSIAKIEDWINLNFEVRV